MEPYAYISYSHADEQFVQRLKRALRRAGISFFAENDELRGSASTTTSEIQQAISEAAIVLYVASPHTRRSVFQSQELRFALEQSVHVVPIVLGDLGGQELPSNANLLHSIHVPSDSDIDLAVKKTVSLVVSYHATVYLAASVPYFVQPGTEFTAKFAAYTNACRTRVLGVFEAESPSSRKIFDLNACQWEPGTRITARLSARGLAITRDTQTFTWNGQWEILRYDIDISPSILGEWIILKFDIFIEGIIVASLRPEIEIKRNARVKSPLTSKLLEGAAPRTAFASYASEDRRDVLSRVRSLQIFTGIDVFLDSLSLRPGERWKTEIVREIQRREVFWLFWSRYARASEWVEWEWRTALDEKTLRAIQPHPLEPVELAPPPTELAELQFGNAYESYLISLRSSWVRVNFYRVKRFVREQLGFLLRKTRRYSPVFVSRIFQVR